MKTRLVVQYSFIQGKYDVWVLDVDAREGQRHLAQVTTTDYQFLPHEEGMHLPDAPFRLEKSEAQRLIDDLYRAGLRPVDAQGTAGQLEAMASHLKDMRSLAFKGNPP